jgi:hypothetical protein
MRSEWCGGDVTVEIYHHKTGNLDKGGRLVRTLDNMAYEKQTRSPSTRKGLQSWSELYRVEQVLE